MRFHPSFLLLAGVLVACGGSESTSGGDQDASQDSSSDGVALDTTPGGDTNPGGDTTPGTDTNPGTDAPVADSGGGSCGAGSVCSAGLTCCGTSCINKQNDPLNCGGCGAQCTGEKSMCQGGTCVRPTCAPACGDGQVCCDVQGPGPSGPPKCYSGPTCPVGCPLCA